MRPNVKTTRDPINLAKMPQRGGMGFDYRTKLKPTAQAAPYVLFVVLAASAASLVITFVARILSPHFSSGYALAIFSVLSVVAAFHVLFTTDARISGSSPLRILLPIAAIGPVCWLPLYLSTWTASPALAYGLPFLATVAAAALFADRFAEHFVQWTAANPRLTADRRGAFLRLWQIRFAARFQPQALDELASLPQAPRKAADSYLPRAGLVGAAYVAGLYTMHQFSRGSGVDALQAGMISLAAFAAVLAAVAWYYGPCPPGVFFSAVVNWFTYNAHETQAPGVFQSPAGSRLRRTAKAVGILFLFIFSAAPLALYFPVGVISSDPQLWAAAGRTTDKALQLLPSRPKLPGRDLILRALSPAERYYYDQLASDSARGQYLDAVAYRYQLAATTTAQDRSFNSQVARRISQTPESWLLVAAVGITKAKAAFVWSLLLSFVLSLIVPIALAGLTVYTLAGSVIGTYHQAIEEDRTDHRSEWQAYVSRLRSLAPEYKPDEHLWLGTAVLNDYPVFLDRSILHEHAHILGDSGSGKTSRGLSPLVAQLTDLVTQLSQTAAEAEQGGGHSVVIIDLKGDPPFFTGARLAAQAAGIPFKWFTNERSKATYGFNFFQQSAIRTVPADVQADLFSRFAQGLTPNQQAEIVLQALSLDHGDGYGASYYSRVNRTVLSEILKKHPEPIRSFTHLQEILEKKISTLPQKTLEDAGELLSVVDNLADIASLNLSPADAGVSESVVKAQIDLADVFRRPQVVYFYLPAAIEAASVKEIGKLALYSLLCSAIQHETKNGKAGRVYLLIDEFQQIVSKDLEIVLRQARSKGIGVVLANQTISDLRTRDGDLTPVVQACTRFRQYFSAGDLLLQDMLMKSAGEALVDLAAGLDPEHPILDDRASWPTDAFGQPQPARELKIVPRLGRNDLIEMSDDPTQSIVHITRGAGLSQFGGYPFLLRSEHHITREQFDAWTAEPWPAAGQETFTPTETRAAARQNGPKKKVLGQKKTT